MMQTDLIPRGVTTTLKKLLFWVSVWLLTTLRENLVLALRYSIVHIQINKHGSKKKPPPQQKKNREI